MSTESWTSFDEVRALESAASDYCIATDHYNASKKSLENATSVLVRARETYEKAVEALNARNLLEPEEQDESVGHIARAV